MYTLSDKDIYCYDCRKSHFEKDVAVCATKDDLNQAVQDFNARHSPRVLLLENDLSDKFQEASASLLKFQEDYSNGVLKAGLIAVGGAVIFGPMGLLTGLATRMYEKYNYLNKIGELAHQKGAYGQCYFSDWTPQGDGTIGVQMRIPTYKQMERIRSPKPPGG